jgi:hypothetical protein
MTLISTDHADAPLDTADAHVLGRKQQGSGVPDHHLQLWDLRFTAGPMDVTPAREVDASLLGAHEHCGPLETKLLYEFHTHPGPSSAA